MEKELEEWFKLHRFHFHMGEYKTRDLAEYLGVSPRTIQRWLKDKGSPNKEQLAKISHYLVSQQAKNESV